MIQKKKLLDLGSHHKLFHVHQRISFRVLYPVLDIFQGYVQLAGSCLCSIGSPTHHLSLCHSSPPPASAQSIPSHGFVTFHIPNSLMRSINSIRLTWCIVIRSTSPWRIMCQNMPNIYQCMGPLRNKISVVGDIFLLSSLQKEKKSLLSY